MANVVMGTQNKPAEYYKMRQLGLQFYISQVFAAQQYRSQALNENRKTELTLSAINERKEAIYKMVEKINLRTLTSTDFLDLVGRKML